MRLRGALLLLLLGGTVSTQTACLFRKKKPTPPPAQMPNPKPAATAKPEPMPPPPRVDTRTPLSTVPAPPEQIDVPAPPPQPPTRPPRPTPAPAQTSPQEPAQPQPPAPPKLVQLLTPAEQRRYQQEMERYLRNAEAIVAAAGTRALNTQQADLVVRIRAFAQQARDQRDQDLMTARNLAMRADVLARDLQRSLR
ncbi:MAG: hypothetical protein IPJ98_29745 [Bryobacterales bacterium]|nr:hypothetical protein [Bryobacterales bacterium]